MRFKRFLGIAIMAVSSAHAWAESTIKVVINPAPTDEGQIIVALCTREAFPHEDRCTVRKIVPAKAAKEPITLNALAAGRYAVLVVNDVNSNNKLDTNLIGIPKEPVGVSRNPALRFGPPRFEDAAFDVSDNAPQELVIDLKQAGK
jgi:uncharacterized protein (DUF2141 family)